MPYLLKESPSTSRRVLLPEVKACLQRMIRTDAQRLSGQWQVHTAFELQATTEALRPELTQPKPQAPSPRP